MTRKETAIQFLKFTMFSISAGGIQALSFTLLNEFLHLEYQFSYLTALTLSVLWNFTFNRRFTFKSANNVPVAMTKVAIYYLIFTPLSTWWGTVFTDMGVNEYIVLGGTMIINFVTEFLFQQLVVYRGQMNTRVSKKDQILDEEV